MPLNNELAPVLIAALKAFVAVRFAIVLVLVVFPPVIELMIFELTALVTVEEAFFIALVAAFCSVDCWPAFFFAMNSCVLFVPAAAAVTAPAAGTTSTGASGTASGSAASASSCCAC